MVVGLHHRSGNCFGCKAKNEMKRIDPDHTVLKRYAKMGGVLNFHFFEESGDEGHDVFSYTHLALCELFYAENYNAAALRRIAPTRVRLTKFLGDWYDPKTKRLLDKGDWTTRSGKTLKDPHPKMLDRDPIQGGGAETPEIGTPGNFAYAFLCPPYPLRASGAAIEDAFAEIIDLIKADRAEAVIHSWNDKSLPDVSPFFADGAEWWGCFLFTVRHVPTSELCVILGSATD